MEITRPQKGAIRMGFYQRPDYERIKIEGKFELRKYKGFTLVKYSNSKDFQMNQGFQTLFNYISNKNDKGVKLSMTVPVIESKDEKKNTMAFVIPKNYKDDPPRPLDDSLEIETFDGGYYAVLSFRGPWKEKNKLDHMNLLKAWIIKNKYEILSDFMTAYYNPPMMPSFLRHNEIWAKVKI